MPAVPMPFDSPRPCLSCGTTSHSTRHWDRRGWYRRCRPCDAARRRMNAANGGSRRRAPRVPRTRLGVARRFGVEFEFNIPGGRSGVRAGRIAAALPNGWRMKYDGSLGSTGVEIASPPLSGEDGLEQVRTVCRLMTDNGATVDRRCGLHVHHEVSDVGATGMARFVRSWFDHQSLLQWLVSPSRRSNSYCRPLSAVDVNAVERWATSDPRPRDYSVRSPIGRYYAVNVQAYMKFGTVEVRQHQGTLSFRKVEAWIKLGQAMLDEVAATQAPVPQQSTLRRFMAAVGLDEDTTAYLTGRAVHFGAAFASIGDGAMADAEVA